MPERWIGFIKTKRRKSGHIGGSPLAVAAGTAATVVAIGIGISSGHHGEPVAQGRLPTTASSATPGHEGSPIDICPPGTRVVGSTINTSDERVFNTGLILTYSHLATSGQDRGGVVWSSNANIGNVSENPSTQHATIELGNGRKAIVSFKNPAASYECEE